MEGGRAFSRAFKLEVIKLVTGRGVVVALKAHRVFLDPTPQSAGRTAIAHAVVQACRAFDATGQLAPDHPIAP